MERMGGGPKTRRGGPGQETAPSTSFNAAKTSTTHYDAEAVAENRRIRFLIDRHFLGKSVAQVIAAECFTGSAR